MLSQGLSYVTRLVRENRRHSAQETEFHLDSLLTIPADYEKLQSVANQPVDDLQGLRLGPRLGNGSGGTVFQGVGPSFHVYMMIEICKQSVNTITMFVAFRNLARRSHCGEDTSSGEAQP